MRLQPLDGVAQQCLAADAVILLWRAAARPKAFSSGNNEGMNGHRSAR
jgi:hypothetical protein